LWITIVELHEKSWRLRRGMGCWASILTLTFGKTRMAKLSALCTGRTLWCSASTNCAATGLVFLKFIIYVMDIMPQVPEILVTTLHLIWLKLIGHQQKTYIQCGPKSVNQKSNKMGMNQLHTLFLISYASST
jgi:hypothetical protein